MAHLGSNSDNCNDSNFSSPVHGSNQFFHASNPPMTAPETAKKKHLVFIFMFFMFLISVFPTKVVNIYQTAKGFALKTIKKGPS